MSSILKALKKLEEERVSTRPELLNINSELLKTRPVKQFTRTGIVLLSGVLFLCGAGATYFSMKRRTAPVTASVQPVTTANNGIQPSAPVTGTEGMRQNRVVVQPPPASTRSSVLPQPGVNDQATKPKTLQDHNLATKSTKIQPISVERTVNPLSASVTKTAQNVPLLTVNGIAFKEGDTESIAVVNGQSVSKGSVVDGATVTEILEDRVKFTIDGKAVEVILGKSNR